MIRRQLVHSLAFGIEGVQPEPCGLPLHTALGVFKGAVRVGRESRRFRADKKIRRAVSQTR